MIDPNKNEDLLTLDRILKAADANLVAVESAQHKGVFRIAYTFNLFGGKNPKLAGALTKAAEDLVVPNGGRIGGHLMGQGFVAGFDSEQDQLGFLQAFGKAAAALYTEQPKEQIKIKPNGFILGNDNEAGYSQFGR